GENAGPPCIVRVFPGETQRFNQRIVDPDGGKVIRPAPDLAGRGYQVLDVVFGAGETARVAHLPAAVAVRSPAGVVIVDRARGRAGRADVGLHHGGVDGIVARVGPFGGNVDRVERRLIHVNLPINSILLDVGQHHGEKRGRDVGPGELGVRVG